MSGARNRREEPPRQRGKSAPLGTHSLTGNSLNQGLPVAKDGVGPGNQPRQPKRPSRP